MTPENSHGRPDSAPTDALKDRVAAWAAQALTRAKVVPSSDADGFVGTVPPWRRFLAARATESEVLATLCQDLEAWGMNEILAGRGLPESPRPLPTFSPEIRGLIKLSRLPGLLRARGACWGVERDKLPAGLVAAVLADLDAVVTRHAAQMPPPAGNLKQSAPGSLARAGGTPMKSPLATP